MTLYLCQKMSPFGYNVPDAISLMELIYSSPKHVFPPTLNIQIEIKLTYQKGKIYSGLPLWKEYFLIV